MMKAEQLPPLVASGHLSNAQLIIFSPLDIWNVGLFNIIASLSVLLLLSPIRRGVCRSKG